MIFIHEVFGRYDQPIKASEQQEVIESLAKKVSSACQVHTYQPVGAPTVTIASQIVRDYDDKNDCSAERTYNSIVAIQALI